MIRTVGRTPVIEQRRWQKCPVCSGKGIVKAGFYLPPGFEDFGTRPVTFVERCRSCDGRGIVR